MIFDNQITVFNMKPHLLTYSFALNRDKFSNSGEQQSLANELLNTTVDGTWRCYDNPTWRNCQLWVKNAQETAKKRDYDTQLAA